MEIICSNRPTLGMLQAFYKPALMLGSALPVSWSWAPLALQWHILFIFAPPHLEPEQNIRLPTFSFKMEHSAFFSFFAASQVRVYLYFLHARHFETKLCYPFCCTFYIYIEIYLNVFTKYRIISLVPYVWPTLYWFLDTQLAVFSQH